MYHLSTMSSQSFRRSGSGHRSHQRYRHLSGRAQTRAVSAFRLLSTEIAGFHRFWSFSFVHVLGRKEEEGQLGLFDFHRARVCRYRGFFENCSAIFLVAAVRRFLRKVSGSSCASPCDSVEVLVAFTKRTRIEGLRNL